jgi:hypothetical protein
MPEANHQSPNQSPKFLKIILPSRILHESHTLNR